MSPSAETTAGDQPTIARTRGHDTVATDACGCVPNGAAKTASASGGGPPPSVVSVTDGEEAPSEAPEPPERTIKLVVPLRPTDTGFRAQLAAGSDNCDPELRVVDVPDVASALATLPDVLTAAQARWQRQPRFASAPRAPATPPTQPPVRAPRGSSAPNRTDTTTVTPAAAPATPAAPHQPPTDQLSLFG